MRLSEHAATVGGVVEAGVGLLAFWRSAVSYGRAAARSCRFYRRLGTLSACPKCDNVPKVRCSEHGSCK
jgi:hypothetical protein